MVRRQGAAAESQDRMLREIKTVRQKDDEPPRRWFQDKDFDLIVWQHPGQDPEAFQLCYDRSRNERVLSWSRTKGYSHDGVDSGEDDPMHNRAPILVADGHFAKVEIGADFAQQGQQIDAQIRNFVLHKIRRYNR